ncbi:hypothetical protein FBALC1_16227 [Flavobacteriales bacterium ALC-1]|nr:hypothetical protein FBALC1_16227 [Flavobacteriales bacterium ALC-1]
MKRVIILIILILNLALSCKSSLSKAELLAENKTLKERINKLEAYDNSNIEAALELKNMNVVYRGMNNPIIISMSNAKEIIAIGKGLTKINNSNNLYNMNAGTGNEVDILIKGIMPNNDTIIDKKTLKIKDIKAPIGTINGIGCGSKCEVLLTKDELKNGIINVTFENFIFDLKVNVTSFKVNLPNKKSVLVEGIRMNKNIINEIEQSMVNDKVVIFDIRVHLSGNTRYKLKKAAPILIRIIE